MKNPLASAFAIPIALASLGGTARANDLHGYWDLIIPEVVGQLPGRSAARPYDLSLKTGKDDWTFVGNTTVAGGTYVGGGFGVRVLVAWPKGLLVGGEALITGGRLTGAELPFSSLSTAMHYEVLTEVGYQLSLDIVMLHLAAVLGFDGMRFDVAGPLAPAGASPSLVTGAGGDPASWRLERFNLRAGGQLGIHVNVARYVALWADGTVDWDGQYRIRGGLGFGAPSF